MNTIGTFLKSAREKKDVGLGKLEAATKIKKVFIRAIEEEDWEKLPEYPVVQGFVRNIADNLGVSTNNALALLRRDYPPKALKISPNPDVEKKFTWSPKFTFAIAISSFLLILLGYLVWQYKNFSSAPKLIIEKPKENEVLISTKVQVEGITNTDSKIEVDNQPILVDQDGNFKGEVEIDKNTTKIIFRAISRTGKETVIEREIQLDL